MTRPHALPPELSRRDALRFLGLAGLATGLAPSYLAAAAPSAPPALSGGQPGHYRFRIAAFEAVALSDGGMAPGVSSSLYRNATTDDAMRATLREAFVPDDLVRLPFSMLLVRTESDLVLVDTGCGATFGNSGGWLAANLRAVGVSPEQITAVFLTHAHFDHCGGLIDASGKQPAFPRARHFISRREYDFWTGEAPDLSGTFFDDGGRRGMVEGARAALTPLASRWEFVAEGDRPITGFEVIDLPGHTPGQIGLLIGEGADRMLHIADVAHHHVLSFAHPEWSILSDAQPALAVATRQRVFARAAAERLRLFGAHLPFPALGHARAVGDRYEYVIEPWVTL